MSTPGKGLQPGTRAFVQARSNGFGAPGPKPSTARERINAEVEDVIEDAAPQITRQALEVFKQSMNSRDEKVRLDAANKAMKTIYHPTQQVEHNVNDGLGLTPALREAADKLSPEELDLVDRVVRGLAQSKQENIVDAEIVGEEVLDG